MRSLDYGGRVGTVRQSVYVEHGLRKDEGKDMESLAAKDGSACGAIA